MYKIYEKIEYKKVAYTDSCRYKQNGGMLKTTVGPINDIQCEWRC